jgi:tight adherence protein B
VLSAAALCLALAAVLLWPAARWANAAAPDVAPRGAGARNAASSWAGHRRRRARARLQSDLADFVALLAAPLRAGATPALAVVAVARSMAPRSELRPLLVDLVQAEPAGWGLSAVWLEHAERLQSADLLFVARAWHLTERTGAPLADALVSVEEVLRARQRARERVATAAAGPRSSMAVLVALPCAGPLVGLAFGIGPRSLYLSSAASLASGVLGLLLGALAWLWARRILDGALRTGTTWTGGSQP